MSLRRAFAIGSLLHSKGNDPMEARCYLLLLHSNGNGSLWRVAIAMEGGVAWYFIASMGGS